MKNIHAEDFLNAVEWLSQNAPDEASRNAFSELMCSWRLNVINIPEEIPVPPRKRGPKGFSREIWMERAQWAECIEDFSKSKRAGLMKIVKAELGPNATRAEIEAEFNRRNAALYAAKRRVSKL